MKKRLLSILLVVCLIVPLLPDYLPVQAEENTDAFGIKMDEEFNEEEAKKNNPYGTEDWMNLFTVAELFVGKGDSNSRSWRTYNYNKDGEEGSIGDPTSSVTSTGKSEGNKDGFSLLDSAACDFKGEGQKRYTATVGYWRNKNERYMQLFLTDASGNRISNTIKLGSKGSLNYLEGAEAHNNTGFISVAAGDFDGDGRDSILVYVPEMKKADDGNEKQPGIYEYTISTSGALTYKGLFSYVYGMLGVSNVSQNKGNDGKIRKNAPVVQMIAEDTDKDNVDELIITAGLNNCSANDMTERQSKMFIYDYVKQSNGGFSWSQTFSLNTKGYSGGLNGAQRLRWASSAVGNAEMTNGLTEYPEIVTAGWIDKNGSDGDNMTDAIGTYITSCTSVTKNEYGTSIGKYTKKEMKALDGTYTDSNGKKQYYVSEFTRGGHNEGDNVHSPLPVAVFDAGGIGGQASVLISDTVYTLNSSSGNFEVEYRPNVFNDNDNGIDMNWISTGLIQDAVGANFDANIDGREQVVFTTCQKRRSHNDYFYRIYTYQKKKDGTWTWNRSGWQIYQLGYAYTSLCALDIDNDSTIVRIKEASMTYTDPEVLSILESSPYFMEVDGGDTGNSETAYGKAEESGSASTTSHGLTNSVVAGFEYELDDVCGGFKFGAGFEATLESSYVWETTETNTVEYELNYSNDTGENMVLVYRRPVTTWCYEVKNSDSKLVLAREGTLLTSMISVDEYNSVAGKYNLSEISDDTLASPGDPFSYRGSTSGLNNVVQSDSWNSYNGGGTISQSFTNSTGTESSFTYEISTEFSAYGVLFSTKVGAGAGYVTTDTSTTINTYSISKLGAVTGKSVEGYDFSWRFAHWTIDLDGQEIPVLGYLVKDVYAPPSPPINLRVTEVTSTTAQLSWDAGNRSADEYRIYQMYQDGSSVQIGVVDGTETTYKLTKLLPNTSYTYAITAYSESGRISGESVFSEEVVVTTLPEGIASVEITSPENVSARIGGNAVFRANIAVVSDEYKATNYQWQKRVTGGNWEDIEKAKSSTLTVRDVQKEDDGNEYRCVFKVSYTSSSSLILYYSAGAKLSTGGTEVTASLTITGHDETGRGTLTNPYRGKSDYQKNGTPVKTTVDAETNVVIPASDSIPELTVYADKTNAGTYYGIGMDEEDGMVYYHVEKEDTDPVSYKAGEQIKEVEKVTYQNLVDASSVVVPEGYDSNVQISRKEDGSSSVYYLWAAVQGTTRTAINAGTAYSAVDTRFANISSLKYYWMSGNEYYSYGENGAIGDQIETSVDEGTGAVLLDGVNVNELFGVYYISDANETTETIILGRNETWTVIDEEESDETTTGYDDNNDYIFSMLTEKTTDPDSGENKSYDVTLMEEIRETIYQDMSGNDVEFNPGSLEIVTKTVQETVEIPTYTIEKGMALTFTATVKEEENGNAAKGAVVDFYVTNTETNAVETISQIAGNNGVASATWTAAAKALYSIQAVVRSNGEYASKETALQYYDAAGTYEEKQTEYRLQVTKNNEEVAGSISYGDSVIIKLQERTVEADGTIGSWEDYTGDDIVYTSLSNTQEEVMASTTCKPEAAGTCSFYAYKSDGTNVEQQNLDPMNRLAASTLLVEKVAVKITPTWEENTIPESISDITLKADPELSEAENLKDIFDITCDYFDLQDKTSASGRFVVMLSYKTYPQNPDKQKLVDAFRNNYTATLTSDNFTKKPDSAQVIFRSGENGSLIGQYSDNNYPLVNNSSMTNGTQLTFLATPQDGYSIDFWTINGVKYTVDDPLPEGMRFLSNGKSIRIASFSPTKHVNDEKHLEISVSFVSVSNTITYSVDSSQGEGTISAVNATGNSLESGARVANGSSVTFTANPKSGYIVKQWMVNDKIYCWDGTDEIYMGTSLTLDNIQEPQTVIVSFKEKENEYEVASDVGNEEGEADASLATVTAVNAETKADMKLPTKVTEGTTITFTAAVTNPGNHMVKEWQTSTDDGNTWKTVAGSGGQNHVTIYNIDSNLKVRVVVTTAQSYRLSYKVIMDQDSTEVEDEKIARLSAVSNGQQLQNGGSVSAYIPVDFTLELNDAYYVTGWSNTVTPEKENGLKASMDSLTKDTEVSVEIRKKPIVTIENVEHGDVIVTNAQEGEKVIQNGDYVNPGTPLHITFVPETGYETDEVTVNGRVVNTVYTDGSGKTTDTRSYEIAKGDIQSDQTISASFKALSEYQVNYSIIQTANTPNGSLSAAAQRKEMEDYSISALASGDKVYAGSEVTLTASPDANYRVKEWIVNGEVQKTSGVTITDNTLKVSDISEVKNVTVQFVQRGNKMTIQAGNNGQIESAMVGKIDQIDSIADGFTLGENASVVITTKADAGYEVEKWTVNDKTVMDGDKNYTDAVYTYQADENSAGADVKVFFRQIPYQITWSGNGGTVTAEGYEGEKARIRGGTEVTFKMNPDAGMVLDYWTVNGEKAVSEDENNQDETIFTWTVPNGAAAVPASDTYKIQAVCKEAPYTVTYEQPKENGTLTAKAGNTSIASGDTVNGNTVVTFTAEPEDGWMVGSWIVDGKTIDSQENEYQITVTSDIAVSVNLIPDTYTITAEKTGKGILAVDEKQEESYQAGYGSDMTFTAEPEDYWTVKEWKVDGETVTEGVSADKTTFTLSNIKQNRKVEVVFTSALLYDLSYSVVQEKGGKLNVVADGTPVTLGTGQSTSIPGGSKLEFTAVPDNGWMVKEWTVNGEVIEGNLSTSLVIEKMTKAVNVTVEYVPYKGYIIPTDGKGYLITEVGRTPDDTTPKTEIRENGDLTFTFALDTENGYNTLSKLVINGYDCIADTVENDQISNCDKLISKQNEDGSYTITIKNVTGEILLDADAHKLEKVEAKEATCIKEGNIEYWMCQEDEMDCSNSSRKFKDKDGKEPLAEGEEIIPADKENGHSFDNPIFTWNGTSSAVATFTCDLCREEKEVSCTISSKQVVEEITYTATAELNGKTWTDIKKETIPHKYGAPTFTWNGTSSATASFTCSQCKDVQKVTCTISSKQEGEKITYTAAAVFEGKTWTDTKTETIPHKYGTPAFTWNGTSSATASFTCSQCGDVKKAECTITSKQEGDNITYTATATFEGKTWTDTKTETIPHKYGAPTFTWNGTSSATALFTCVNCGETKTVNCKVTSKSGKDTVTYTATVTLEGKTYKDVQTVDVKMSNVEFKLQGRTSKNAIRLTWQRVPAVKGYDIFRAQCNGKKLKLIKTIKGNSKRTWTDTKKKANSQYKYYVKAYKLVNGKKKYVNQSNMIHIALPSRYTNVKTVKAASKLSLKKGKQKKLSVKLSYERKGKKLVKHMNYLSYKTTNKKVATVTSKGVIRARSKGSCYVYITAASGAYTRVKVTVK